MGNVALLANPIERRGHVHFAEHVGADVVDCETLALATDVFFQSAHHLDMTIRSLKQRGSGERISKHHTCMRSRIKNNSTATGTAHQRTNKLYTAAAILRRTHTHTHSTYTLQRHRRQRLLHFLLASNKSLVVGIKHPACLASLSHDVLCHCTPFAVVHNAALIKAVCFVCCHDATACRPSPHLGSNHQPHE